MYKISLLSVMVVLGLLLSTAAFGGTALYMSFDQEPSGGIVPDESGQGNNGNIIGEGISWTSDGKFGGALKFDGTTKIEVPYSESLNLSEEMTAEIWLRTTTALSGIFLMYKGHVGTGRNYEWGLYITTNSTKLQVYVVEPADAVSAATNEGNFMDGEWHFLAGTYDGAVVQNYADGNLVAAEWVASLRTSEGPLTIGAWSNFFTGDLDEARVLDVALDEAALKSDYEGGYASVEAAGKLSTTWAEIKAR